MSSPAARRSSLAWEMMPNTMIPSAATIATRAATRAGWATMRRLRPATSAAHPARTTTAAPSRIDRERAQRERTADGVGGLCHPPLALAAQPVGPGHELVVGQVAGLVQVGRPDRVAEARVGPGRLDQPGVGDEPVGHRPDVVAVLGPGHEPRVGEGAGRLEQVGVVLRPAVGRLEARGDQRRRGGGVGRGQVGAEVGDGGGQLEALLAGIVDGVGVAVGDPPGDQAAERERGGGHQGEGHEQAAGWQRHPPGCLLDPVEQAPRR